MAHLIRVCSLANLILRLMSLVFSVGFKGVAEPQLGVFLLSETLSRQVCQNCCNLSNTKTKLITIFNQYLTHHTLLGGGGGGGGGGDKHQENKNKYKINFVHKL